MSDRFLVTGGAGFIGSHLCERLLERGEVVCLDNLVTGRRENLSALEGRPGFAFVEADCIEGLPLPGRFTGVWHLASLAAPRHYLAHPVATLRVGAEGTRHALARALSDGARFLLTSTSEVYGDPHEHPQREEYWGHVNCVGPRGCYDESKRYAEALATAFHGLGVDIRIARLFNTYGPRMTLEDGRVVPAFVAQALRGEPLTVYGDGRQTRSFCFIDDLVDGLLALWDRGDARPVNLGNPDEFTILAFAAAVLRATGSTVPLAHRPLPTDDPRQRQPDIARARTLLGWEPRIDLEEGLARTVASFRPRVQAGGDGGCAG